MAKEDCFHLGVKALLFREKGEMLLLRLNPKKFDLTADGDQVIWDLPGGRINRGETPLDALRREVFEETGITEISEISPVTIDLTTIRVPTENGDCGVIYATYSCRLAQEETLSLSFEHLGYTWVVPEIAASLLPLDFPENLRAKLLDWNVERLEI